MRSFRFQGGFAAIAAVFLIVILAGMGAFMLTFSNTQQITSAQDIEGTRGYWAARAGLDWGIGGMMAAAVPSPCPASSTNFSTTLSTTLSTTFDGGFTVTVRCSGGDYAEATANRSIYQFTSTASNNSAVGSINYVERSVSASIEIQI